jgi:hypothetical protein
VIKVLTPPKTILFIRFKDHLMIKSIIFYKGLQYMRG